jgi:bacterioferritin
MSSKALLNMLTEGISIELHISMKYMWQHILVKGLEGLSVGKVFREIAITEMKHAEDLTKRLALLNGVPPNGFDPVHPGLTLEEMLKEDEQLEERLVTLYKQAIHLANKEGDFATRGLLEKILIDEEKHSDAISKLLVGMTSPFTQP